MRVKPLRFNSGRTRTTYLRARPARRDVVAGFLALVVVAAYLALWTHGLGVLPR